MSAPKSKSVKRSRPAPTRPVDVYATFSIWTNQRSPQWHGIRKMRYVFWRMMSGKTITDAIREIHWSSLEFYRLLQVEREGTTPHKEEYLHAKVLQSRAVADSVMVIAEARDAHSRRRGKTIEKIIRKAMRKNASTKQMVHEVAKYVVETISGFERDLIARNKLQIDAAKWFAAKVNPNEFAEKSAIGLSGLPHAGEGDKTRAIVVTFIAADGSEVPFAPDTPAVEAT